jgi:hypothetical protein
MHPARRPSGAGGSTFFSFFVFSPAMIAPDPLDSNASIEAHRQAKTCSICSKPLDPSKGYFSHTHAHTECHSEQEKAAIHALLMRTERPVASFSPIAFTRSAAKNTAPWDGTERRRGWTVHSLL